MKFIKIEAFSGVLNVASIAEFYIAIGEPTKIMAISNVSFRDKIVMGAYSDHGRANEVYANLIEFL